MRLLNRAVVAVLVLGVLPACSVTRTAQPVVMQAGEARAIAVIENPDVTGDYLTILQSALAAKGFTVSVVPAGTAVGAHPLTATYEADWSWDFVTYMAYSLIEVYRNGTKAGDVVYDAPRMGTSLTTDIYDSTETKVFSMVNQLFPAPVQP